MWRGLETADNEECGDHAIENEKRDGRRDGKVPEERRRLTSSLPAPGLRVVDPVVTSSGERIVYTESLSDTNIRRMSLSGPDSGTDVLFRSSRQTNSPQHSPDGRQIAFVSDHSGSWEIWVAAADRSNPRQWTHFGRSMVGTPHWSPDGRELVFDARPNGYANLFVASKDTRLVHQLFSNSRNSDSISAALPPDREVNPPPATGTRIFS